MTIRPLSPSRAMRLIASTPARALAEQEVTRAMERGTIIHGMVLGSPSELEVIHKVDAKTGVVEVATDYRTKSAQEARDRAREAGRVPVLAHERESFEQVSAIIKAQLAGYLDGATTETLFDWESVVPCRCRIDILTTEVIGDLKTCDDAMASSSDASIFKSGYDIQAAATLDAIETLYPERAGRLAFLLHFAELEPLGDARIVQTVEVGGSMLEIGRIRWKRAKDIWRRCHETGIWPGYSADVRRAEAPPWAIAAETYQAAAAMGQSERVPY